MEQEERLDRLVEQFLEDSGDYKDMRIPDDQEEKRVLLRSLMNIRMPRGMDEEVLKLQDDYLKQRNLERGIVDWKEIPEWIKGSSVSLWQGDITRLSVDAIVNAANSQMLGCFIPMHACIDNCIHTYAGIELRAECARQMNQKKIRYGREYEMPVGETMLTKGYNLPAKKVIHVTGPMVTGRLTEKLKEDLAACYRNVLETCKENGLKSVAFCCLSTGVFRFPNREASHIAVSTVKKWLSENPGVMDRVIFNVFKDEDRRYYEQELSR